MGFGMRGPRAWRAGQCWQPLNLVRTHGRGTATVHLVAAPGRQPGAQQSSSQMSTSEIVHEAVGGANYSCGTPLTQGGRYDPHELSSSR